MSGKYASSKVLVRAGVAAAAAMMAFAGEAEAGKISFHVIWGSGPPTQGVWVTILTAHQSWSALSPDLSSGHLDYMVPSLDPAMGLGYSLTDGTALTGADVTGVMGGMDVSGVGSPQMQMAGINVWITWELGPRRGGIHLIDIFGSALAFEGTTPEGQLAYGAHGLSIPVSFHETEDGLGKIGTQNFFVTDLEWVSDAALPAPGAIALAGVGLLAAARRRRG